MLHDRIDPSLPDPYETDAELFPSRLMTLLTGVVIGVFSTVCFAVLLWAALP